MSQTHVLVAGEIKLALILCLDLSAKLLPHITTTSFHHCWKII